MSPFIDRLPDAHSKALAHVPAVLHLAMDVYNLLFWQPRVLFPEGLVGLGTSDSRRFCAGEGRHGLLRLSLALTFMPNIWIPYTLIGGVVGFCWQVDDAGVDAV